MSIPYIRWARGVSSLKADDKLLLMLIADDVDETGTWQISVGDLARDAMKSFSTVRRALDRMAAQGLIVFRSEVYRGSAQAAHRFRLVRTSEERQKAIAEGFAAERSMLDREVISNTIPPQSCKEGPVTPDRRVLSLLKGHRTPQKTPQNSSAHARASGRKGPPNLMRAPAQADDPTDPLLEFDGGFKRRRSFVKAAVADWRTKPRSWPLAELGPPPDSPSCRVPPELLAAVPDLVLT